MIELSKLKIFEYSASSAMAFKHCNKVFLFCYFKSEYLSRTEDKYQVNSKYYYTINYLSAPSLIEIGDLFCIECEKLVLSAEQVSLIASIRALTSDNTFANAIKAALGVTVATALGVTAE